MKMNPYRVTPLPVPDFMIVAKNTFHASEIFTTYAAAAGFFRTGKLQVEQLDLDVSEQRMPGLKLMLDREVPGVAEFTNFGWSLKPLG